MLNYQQKWENYRSINQNFWLFFIVGILLLLVFLTGFFEKFFNDESYFILLLGISLIISSYFGLRLQYWSCPQCGKSFHKKLFYSWMYSAKCLHCGLPKYEGSIFKK